MPAAGGEPPIPKVLWGTVSVVARAFDDALATVGGSRAMWFIFLSLKARPVANQRELAAEVGIQGATLTHHLTAMEQAGLINRRRDPANRRVHLVELTPAGEATFLKLREVALAFDRKLREGIPDDDIRHLRQTLARLQANATDDPAAPTP
ncbi:MarR family winged helix-turn-helix transcriptional regulator [Phytoactinopolyspora limicola]|uniref:MarR family winged helix-turn-helix transcriptional regulator n=1 Tax=Phytoactinopolyspora limicola TaxID=2715536 RepID=UPI00140D5DB6|nr:MarR family winged helix-turn-helix transcriptional regulator [Phytoactinopolyspora limicola]